MDNMIGLLYSVQASGSNICQQDTWRVIGVLQLFAFIKCQSLQSFALEHWLVALGWVYRALRMSQLSGLGVGQVQARLGTVPSQCRQRLGSGGASSSPSSRCRTGMAAHPAPAPPVRQYTGALHLDRSCSGGGVAAATELIGPPPAPAGRRRPFARYFGRL